MGSVLTLAKMTFKETTREKLFVVFVVFALLIYFISIALGHLSFAEQERISLSFGLASMHFVSCMIAIYLGSALYFKEFERKTIHLVLSKPLSRLQYLLGKFFGFACVLSVFVFGIGLLLAALVYLNGVVVNPAFIMVVLFVFLEALLILSVAIFFAHWSRPIVGAFASASVFLVGHWLESLKFFAERSDSFVFKSLSKFVVWIWPDLEKLNFRGNFISSTSVAGLDMLTTASYSLFVSSVFLALSHLILTRKNLV